MARIGIIVQGEGRGHQTQALAFLDIIRTTHHQVVCCLIGKGGNTQGQYLLSEVELPIIEFRSPYLRYNKKTQRLDVTSTCINTILDSALYYNSICLIHRTIASYDIDLIINFYDLLGGIYNALFNRGRIPFIAVAHQYLHWHKCFPHPNGHYFGKLSVNFTSVISSLFAEVIVALSFDYHDVEKNSRLRVHPPLIRKRLQITDNTLSTDLLCYVNLPEMVDLIIDWFRKSSLSNELHIYTSDPVDNYDNIYFHRLDPYCFIEHMKRCQLLICTAGFESVCEAFYLGKKCLLLPMPNHYEQLANAFDARRLEVGAFDVSSVSKAFSEIQNLSPHVVLFRSWVNSGDNRMTDLIDEMLVRNSYTPFIRNIALSLSNSLYVALKFIILRPIFFTLGLNISKLKRSLGKYSF